MKLEAGLDFREPQYRRQVFLDFYAFHCKYKAHPGAVYYAIPMLLDRLECDEEQRLWFLYINGCTQNVVTTYMIYKRFPDVKSINLKKLISFINSHWKGLFWDMDRRYTKAKFVEMVRNYIDVAVKPTGYQKDFFDCYTQRTHPEDNFQPLWDEVIANFKYYGRLATFSYLEYLRIGGVNIECNDLFFDDINGSKSHRNGLCKVLGRDDLEWTKENYVNYTPELLEWINTEAELLFLEAKHKIGHPDVSYFTFESTLCCYKGWFRKNRRYPNVYNDMFADRINWSLDRLGDKDVNIFWDIRKEFLPKHLRIEDNEKDVGLAPLKQNHFRNTGEVIMMNKDYPHYKNTYNDFTGA